MLGSVLHRAHRCSASCMACSKSSGLLGTRRASRIARSDCNSQVKRGAAASKLCSRRQAVKRNCVPAHLASYSAPLQPGHALTVACRRPSAKRGVSVARPTRLNMVALMPGHTWWGGEAGLWLGGAACGAGVHSPPAPG